MISVLLASYNGAKYIGEQIKSAAKSCQLAIVGYEMDYEIVISDDCSTDSTKALVAQHSGNRVRLIEPASRCGSALKNFSYLIEHGHADYILLSDQDDVWLSDKVKVSLTKLKTMESEFGVETPLLVFTDAQVVDEHLNEIAPSFWRYDKMNPEFCRSFKKLVIQNVGQGATMIFNRALLEKARPIPEGAIMHDWWLMLVAAAFGKIDYIDQPTLLYRQHGANELGAMGFTLKSALDKALHHREKLRGSIAATQRQARAFVDCYGPELDRETRSFLKRYATLSGACFLRRKLFCLRHGLVKTSPLRTLGFYILV